MSCVQHLGYMQQLGLLFRDANTLPWLAYCAFHLGEYEKAEKIYR